MVLLIGVLIGGVMDGFVVLLISGYGYVVLLVGGVLLIGVLLIAVHMWCY